MRSVDKNFVDRLIVQVALLMTAVLCAVIQPAFEAPDEPSFRLPKLLATDQAAEEGNEMTSPLELGTAVLRRLIASGAEAFDVRAGAITACRRVIALNPDFDYGSNAPRYVIPAAAACSSADYRILRVLFAVAAVGAFLAFRPPVLLMASLAYPAAFYAATQISTDAVFVLLALVGGWLTLSARYGTLIVVAALAILVDRSAVTLLAFAAVMNATRINLLRRIFSSTSGALWGLLFGITVGLTVRFIASQVPLFEAFYRGDVLGNEAFGQNPIRQAGALFLSAWYLGGNMSFRAFYIEYVAFAALLVTIYLARPSRFSGSIPLEQVRVIVSATILVMAAITAIIPPLTQARYYLFVVPSIVIALAGILKWKPSALALGFCALNVMYGLSAAATS